MLALENFCCEYASYNMVVDQAVVIVQACIDACVKVLGSQGVISNTHSVRSCLLPFSRSDVRPKSQWMVSQPQCKDGKDLKCCAFGREIHRFKMCPAPRRKILDSRYLYYKL